MDHTLGNSGEIHVVHIQGVSQDDVVALVVGRFTEPSSTGRSLVLKGSLDPNCTEREAYRLNRQSSSSMPFLSIQMPFQQGTVAIYPVNGQLHPLPTNCLISTHRLQVNLSILIGFINSDAGITKEIADCFIVLLRSITVRDNRHIPHLLQDIAILNLPASKVALLFHVPVQPDTLIGGLVQAAGKDGVTAHVRPERLVVAVKTVGTAQQRILRGKAVPC